MAENTKKFLEAVSKDEGLAKKVSTMTKEELIALAKELGIELTEADFAKPAGELDDDELCAVAGGSHECYCMAGGGGSADENDETCVCVVAGVGKSNTPCVTDGVRCGCPLVGVGIDC